MSAAQKFDAWGNPIDENGNPNGEAPKAEAKPEKAGPETAEAPKKRGRKKKDPSEKKAPKAKMSELEKFQSKLSKEVKQLPNLQSMFVCPGNATLKVKDIAICLSEKPIEDDELAEMVRKSCPLVNVVNYETEISAKRILAVMKDVMHAGKFFFDIEVVEIKQDGVAKYQCVSGRHRLAGISLLWGSDVEIPVTIKKGLTLKEARLMAVYANNTRGISRLEKASIRLSEKLNGGIDSVDTDEGFTQAVDSKKLASDYILLMLKNGIVKFNFPVQIKGNHSTQDAVATISGIETFFNESINYTKGDTSREFKKQAKDSAAWLDKMYSALCNASGFVLREHFSKRALGFYGYLYQMSMVNSQNVDSHDLIASRAVKINGMGSLKKTEIIKAYQQVLRAEIK